MYSKRLGRIRIEFVNVRLTNLLVNLINMVILTSLTNLTRLAVLTSQTNNNNDTLDRLIKIQISKTNSIHLKICLEDFISSLDFHLRSINIDLIILFVLNVAIQVIVLIVVLTYLIRTE